MYNLKRNQFVTRSSGNQAGRPRLHLCGTLFLCMSMILLLIKFMHCLKKKKKRIITIKKTLLGLLVSTESLLLVLYFLWVDPKIVSAREHLHVTNTRPNSPALSPRQPRGAKLAVLGNAADERRGFCRSHVEGEEDCWGLRSRRGTCLQTDSGTGLLGFECWLCDGARSLTSTLQFPFLQSWES